MATTTIAQALRQSSGGLTRDDSHPISATCRTQCLADESQRRVVSRSADDGDRREFGIDFSHNNVPSSSPIHGKVIDHVDCRACSAVGVGAVGRLTLQRRCKFYDLRRR